MTLNRPVQLPREWQVDEREAEFADLSYPVSLPEDCHPWADAMDPTPDFMGIPQEKHRTFTSPRCSRLGRAGQL